MPKKMIYALIVFGIALFLIVRYSTDPMTPMQRSVAQKLPEYGFNDVDVMVLSTDQIAEIAQLLNSDKGTAQITGTIKAVLDRGPRN